MKYTKSDSKTSPLVTVQLNQGEAIKMEPGAMVFHNGKVKLEGKMNGGIGKAFMKKMFTGESFFITTATGTENGGEIGIAPAGFGDIYEIPVGPTQWLLNDGVYLASDASVDYTTKSQGIGKAMFGKTGGFFIIQTSGQGSMLVTAFGSLLSIDLDGSKDVFIDNGHVVGWQDTLSYKMEVASGTFGFTTGEGLVCRFSGQGKVLIQTRNLPSFAGILSGFFAQ